MEVLIVSVTAGLPLRLSKIEYAICLSGAFPLVSGTDGTVWAIPVFFP